MIRQELPSLLQLFLDVQAELHVDRRAPDDVVGQVKRLDDQVVQFAPERPRVGENAQHEERVLFAPDQGQQQAQFDQQRSGVRGEALHAAEALVKLLDAGAVAVVALQEPVLQSVVRSADVYLATIAGFGQGRRRRVVQHEKVHHVFGRADREVVRDRVTELLDQCLHFRVDPLQLGREIGAQLAEFVVLDRPPLPRELRFVAGPYRGAVAVRGVPHGVRVFFEVGECRAEIVVLERSGSLQYVRKVDNGRFALVQRSLYVYLTNGTVAELLWQRKEIEWFRFACLCIPPANTRATFSFVLYTNALQFRTAFFRSTSQTYGVVSGTKFAKITTFLHFASTVERWCFQRLDKTAFEESSRQNVFNNKITRWPRIKSSRNTFQFTRWIEKAQCHTYLLGVSSWHRKRH